MLNNAHKWTRRLGRLGAVVILATGLVAGAGAVPASALTPLQNRFVVAQGGANYVALGDSFTGGQGAPPYTEGPCLRSAVASYPSMTAAISRYRLVANTACSGATIADVLAQLEGVSPSTGLVTMTIGGVDAGSNVVLGACAPDPAGPACAAAIQASAQALPALTPRLASLFRAVASALPRARVVVLNYPRMFEPGLLPVGDLYNATTDALNAVIQGAVAVAASPRVTYTDVTQEFAGHGIGSSVPYISLNLADPTDPANFHPNALGNALGYTRALINDGVVFRR